MISTVASNLSNGSSNSSIQDVCRPKMEVGLDLSLCKCGIKSSCLFMYGVRNRKAENAKYLFDNLPFMGSKDFVKKVQRSNDLLAEMEAKIFACQMTSPTIYVNVDVLAHIFSSTDASTASMLEGLLNKEIPQKLRASTHTHMCANCRAWTRDNMLVVDGHCQHLNKENAVFVTSSVTVHGTKKFEDEKRY
ncbi:hypothetical protein POM88_001876 [Heracleum sosnowskyi]|uniref:Uncharacterized protein n=1 Tax=Heracleum sosnowskyi TaxID=360622 RepID=A0AAD8NB97_9APIA|nr:hypothetical protein POM88_001876 [Heracleum sosnowskyi]